jgi:hypothetical protein
VVEKIKRGRGKAREEELVPEAGLEPARALLSTRDFKNFQGGCLKKRAIPILGHNIQTGG